MVAVVMFMAASSNESIETSYRNFEIAKSSGEVSRGWLPEYLPESAGDIHEVHRIEHPKIWCAFRIPRSDIQSFEARLQSVRTLPESVRYIPNPGKWWWPSLLIGTLDTGKLKQHGISTFIRREHVVLPAIGDRPQVILFAVDGTHERIFFYEAPEL